ncbi:iron-sulfur cluster repair protein YtfE [Serratia odorifera]|jgi:regulator of cell morphogenesis and NO signaling|uniref:Iron-sulfur cluster repair protein YtfE n=2 Tax=Serratia odorifera TaxID=618 RepID=D4DY60_SEROD|nr:iron-sulfur cluster repair protein YtfE [Serratia odorifera]EFE97552.1 iron-sulfur cluster repair di-iron protein [Serratia odorifera DSM 4582]MBJ2067365.1 iron-sulfur cluster repair protein YtfE [Serratia odorifera]PNK91998.1 iron-sulfur cluster repair protein YtfE [Serratia odorifera]RII73163.1 iron-sulfur cluster repair protein YtfE [Serratia odorifera]VDZ53667.1 Regulator of cell morphogenesis and NO signaling [Serratia odorifera]
MDYHNHTLGALAIAIPGASKLFRDHDLDFCCGGKRTLQHAAQRKSLDLQQLQSQLAALATGESNARDWRQAPLAEIIDYILPRFHQRHREQLPELVLMAEKVERVHGDKPACPRGLAKQLMLIRQDLDNHMMKEEQILFPMIVNGMGRQAMGPIAVMEHEHAEAGEQLEVLKFLTNNLTPPANACTTWQALYRGIDQFIADLMEHIHLENNLLFPRALGGE